MDIAMQGPNEKIVGEYNQAGFFRPWNHSQASSNFLIDNIIRPEVEQISRDESAENCAKQHGSDGEDSDSVASSSSASTELDSGSRSDYVQRKRVRKVRRKLFLSGSEESCHVPTASGSNSFSARTNDANLSGETTGCYNTRVPCYINALSENPSDVYPPMSAEMRSRFGFASANPAFFAPYKYVPPHMDLWLSNLSQVEQMNLSLGLVSVPFGNYGQYMKDAVEQLYQQDIAVKQEKKLRPKKFRCEHCDVAFSNNGQLKGHVRIHTGERPFKCEVNECNKAFTRNEELTRHRKIHTGLKPHTCNLCGKCFGRKDHLKKHQRTHQNRGFPEPFSSGTMFGYGGPQYTCLPSGQPLPVWHHPVCT